MIRLAFFQLVAGHRFKVVGPVAVGSSVQGTTGIGNDFKMLFVRYVVTSLEHHMLKEMQLYRIKSGENWGHV